MSNVQQEMYNSHISERRVTRTSGDVGALRHMIIVAIGLFNARIVSAPFSCIDTVILILSDNCDTVAWTE